MFKKFVDCMIQFSPFRRIFLTKPSVKRRLSWHALANKHERGGDGFLHQGWHGTGTEAAPGNTTALDGTHMAQPPTGD